MYYSYRKEHHKKDLKHLKWNFNNRLAGFKKHLNSKKWTLAQYNYEVSRWTKRFNWEYKNLKKFSYNHTVKFLKYRRDVHVLFASGKISGQEYHKRFAAS